MTEADIIDGDFALLRYAMEPQNGEIMLVRHEDASTLKRIKIREATGQNEEVYICWEDGSGKSVRLDKEEYEIQGSLVAIQRNSGRHLK